MMNLYSTLETYDVLTKERSTIFKLDKHMEAPNWTMDGKYIIYNSDGLIWQYDLATGEHSQIDTGDIISCNNDHVLSADGKEIAISSMTPGTDLNVNGYNSYIYILLLTGGTPRKVTPLSPSFLHGWSPDGTTLAYCAMRQGENGDIYTIPVEGGEETRLTYTEGLSDGPEYSADGEHIWFNSVKSGLMQIWRMDKDGSNQQRITTDERNNWFPHISPDNNSVAYISYNKDDVNPGDHPANKNVQLNIMNYDGTENKLVVELFGGQGTFNVNSWSPDSRKFAFVSYELK
ncbi:MAG: TolB family protein [Mobilitalea sp.]